MVAFQVGQTNTNLAWGKGTSASSSTSILFESARAVDGFTYNSLVESEAGLPKRLACMSTNQEAVPWWAVDLGAVHNVVFVVITPGGQATSELSSASVLTS